MRHFILTFTLLLFSLTTHATLPSDSIQRCLDTRRLADFTSQQKMTAKKPYALHFSFHKIKASELPLENPVGNMDEIIQALTNQIDNCKQKRGEFQAITIDGKRVERQEWCLNTNQKMLLIANASKGDFKHYLSAIQREFDWYQSDGWPQNHAGFKKGDFQFTAYYAPAPIESHTKLKGDFLYPLYSNPGVVNATVESKKFNLKTPLCGRDSLTQLPRSICLKNANGSYSAVPDKEEIDKGALDPKYLIGYLKDPNDLAFIMLQGSGSLILDGKKVKLNYETYNGRPRTMLGRIIQCAQDPTCGGNLMTMRACAKNPKCHDEAKLRCNVSKEIRQSAASEKQIRNYLNSLSQEKATDLRHRDQSYVFFVKEDGGPYGSENIPLTAHVSCATDHRVIPIGMNFIHHQKHSTSVCIAQDAGGAIVGAHVDIYKGEGERAGVEAHLVNNGGALFIALPKSSYP